ncbi:Methyl-branched lipid omega-hydroxylase [Paraconexibacter sp. AEG42_29]|uniref:Methyl-branched lipid omega-hydroxylase n=1 Tax=Paraconexibacter sp. AEG42_29 TaxID=2997339 RepID=A0AAU7ARN9_9ACTN
MSTQVTQKPTIDDPAADISARGFWERPYEERDDVFATFRKECPVSWHRPYESTLLPPDEDTPGFWSLWRWADCREVSRDVSRFVSGKGIVMEDFPEIVQIGAHSFLAMDGTDHRQQRGIVHTAFTPRNVKKIESWIHDHARELVEEMQDKGEGEFCQLFAKELPGRIFAHFFGVEQGTEEQQILMDAAEKMLAWDDPEAAQGRDAITTHAEEAMRIQDVALEVAEKRREKPGDDLVSWVVNAEFEGRKLEDWEIMSFFSLLGSAANDTTRHTIAHAVRLLSEHPDQRELFLSDIDAYSGKVIEETLRHSGPIQHFRRTAIVDTTIGGVDIKAGEKLVMWYCSGNRDEDVFPDAAKFDINRETKNHLAFGAGGPHFCIGSALGREMGKAALQHIYKTMPDIDLAGDPVYVVSNFLNGVHHLPVRWTPPS